MTKKAKPASEPAADLREPTEAEAKAIAAAEEILAARPSRVVANVEKIGPAGVLTVQQPHSNGEGWSKQLVATLGTSSPDFADEALKRVANAVGDGRSTVTTSQYSGALALMGGIDPQNELEAAIGEQIIAAHVASMDFMRRARCNAGESFEIAAAYANMATKVSRTMATHVETLAKLRSGGKQQVVVKHIYVQGDAYVGDDGQAVFGGVEGQGGGGGGRKAGQPHTQPHTLAYAPGEPLWGADADGIAMPSASGSRSEALSDARLRAGIGSAQGEGERPLSHGLAHPGTSRG